MRRSLLFWAGVSVALSGCSEPCGFLTEENQATLRRNVELIAEDKLDDGWPLRIWKDLMIKDIMRVTDVDEQAAMECVESLL